MQHNGMALGILYFRLSDTCCSIFKLMACMIYCIGIVGIIWFVAWLFLVFNTPADHPRISPEEHHYIESSIDSELLLQESVKEVCMYVCGYLLQQIVVRVLCACVCACCL